MVMIYTPNWARFGTRLRVEKRSLWLVFLRLVEKVSVAAKNLFQSK